MLMLRGELVAFKSQPRLMYSVKLSIYISKASTESVLELTVHGPFITKSPVPWEDWCSGWLSGQAGG